MSQRSAEWARQKVVSLRKPARDAPPGVRSGRGGLLVALQSNLTIIETVQKQLAEIEKAIVQVAKSIYRGVSPLFDIHAGSGVSQRSSHSQRNRRHLLLRER